MDIVESILQGVAAVVTGGTKGVGRGVAHELARRGARVFVTGRSAPEVAVKDDRPGDITLLRCDHRIDDDVDAVFDRIGQAAGAIDILVNGVWAGYDNMLEDGQFTWGRPFWLQPCRNSATV